MDAVRFIEERKRMCKAYTECIGCPMSGKSCSGYSLVNAEYLVGSVEKWSKENPCKTRQSEFLKLFPEAYVGGDGCLVLNPCEFYPNMRKECTNKYNWCADCRHEFWSQEVR